MSALLITEQYRAQQSELHAAGDYGLVGKLFGELVSRHMKSLGVNSILDYGCGSHRSLLKGLSIPDDVVYEGYDPCVPAYSAEPCPAELVVCLDVLEHIEPPLLDNVLDHLGELCDPYGLFTIHTGPAAKLLPDGRNAHLIQEGRSWWLPKIEQRFTVLGLGKTSGGFFVLVRSRGG